MGDLLMFPAAHTRHAKRALEEILLSLEPMAELAGRPVPARVDSDYLGSGNTAIIVLGRVYHVQPGTSAEQMVEEWLAEHAGHFEWLLSEALLARSEPPF